MIQKLSSSPRGVLSYLQYLKSLVSYLNVSVVEVFDPISNKVEVVHDDRLKQTNTKVNMSLAEATSLERAVCLDSPPHTHNYNLRNHNNQNA